MTFVSDLTFVAGVGCLAAAGYELHPALAWLVCGVALVGVALGIAKKKKGSS